MVPAVVYSSQVRPRLEPLWGGVLPDEPRESDEPGFFFLAVLGNCDCRGRSFAYFFRVHDGLFSWWSAAVGFASSRMWKDRGGGTGALGYICVVDDSDCGYDSECVNAITTAVWRRH